MISNKEEIKVVIKLTDAGEGLNKTLESLEIQEISEASVILIGEKVNGFQNVSSYQSALEAVDTPYVMFMKEGDQTNDAFIRSCVELLNEKPHAGLAVGKYYSVNPLESDEPIEHILSKKYSSLRAVNYLDTKPQKILVSLDAVVLRTENAKEIGFKSELGINEEADFVLRYLLENRAYCTVPEAKYYYTSFKDNQVLYCQNSHLPEWYSDSIEKFILPLLDFAEEKYGEIPAFLQNYCMYHIDSRIFANMNNRNKKVLLGEDLDTYIALLSRLLSRLDDYYILNQDSVAYITKNPEIRCMYLQLKYGVDKVKFDYGVVFNQKGPSDLEMHFNGCLISKLKDHSLSLIVMNYFDGKLWIDGSLSSIYKFGNVRFFAEFNGKEYPITDTNAYSQTKFFGVAGYRRVTYHLEFPLNPDLKLQRVTFFAEYEGKKIPMKINFTNHWAKLSSTPKYSYWKFNKYICHHAENGLAIKTASLKNVAKRELQLQLELIKTNFKEWWNRIIYWVTRPYFKRKKIWLLLDKLYKGGDSAEYLYRYSAGFNDGITKYYLINKDTSDYKMLKRDGFKPLVNGTLLHKLVFFNADIVMITNSHAFPFNGYVKEESKYIRGLCNFGTMCLQHGLSVQKCAIAQRRIIDNTVMYFLATKAEYDNLSKPAYGYKDFDILKITGIGRYDGLINNDQKQILLSPTWRMYNAMPVAGSEGEQRRYNPEFKNTVYYEIYNSLINNEKLISAAKKNGYKIKYLLHPILSAQAEDFTPGEGVEVIPSVGDLSYEKILTESSLMVTDYSGVQFDFAYMRKPVLYFLPEELPAHYEDGAFFCETMGFGEICKTIDALVDTICDYMEHDCAMKDEYRKRADDFYEYSDHNNCERIYKEALKFQQGIDRDKLRK